MLCVHYCDRLEKPEGTIKNRESRDIGIIGTQKTGRKQKSNIQIKKQKQNTTQNTK